MIHDQSGRSATERPVLIVGAGPAGSATALALRARGVSVILFDRERFPRDKVCGDVVLPSAQTALRRLGVDTGELERRAFLCTGSRYVAPSGRQVAGTFHRSDGAATPWWMIRRRTLDAFLVAAAQARGAELREEQQVVRLLRAPSGQVVGLISKGRDGAEREVLGSAVVGADGAGSLVARQLERANMNASNLCLAARTYVSDLRLPEPYLEIFTTSRTLPGCAWAVPVAEDVANVGIGVIKADAARLGLTPQKLFQDVVAQVPLLAERLVGKKLDTLRGWSLPGASQRRKVHGPGCLLVGDAGAMIDVFTGHGIHTAIKAGAIAGEVLYDALSRGDVSEAALSIYSARCSAEFLEEAARARHLQRLHRSPLLMNGVARACASIAPLRQLFLGLLGHAQPRHTLLSISGVVGAFRQPAPGLFAKSVEE